MVVFVKKDITSINNAECEKGNTVDIFETMTIDLTLRTFDKSYKLRTVALKFN